MTIDPVTELGRQILQIVALARATGGDVGDVLCRALEYVLATGEGLAAAADKPWEHVRADLEQLAFSLDEEDGVSACAILDGLDARDFEDDEPMMLPGAEA